MIGTRGGEEMAGLPLRCHVVLPGLPAGANVAVCERASMLPIGDTNYSGSR